MGYTLFNTTNLADVFSNQLDLVYGVINMDASFNNTINTDISNVTGSGTNYTTYNGNKLYLDTSNNQTLYPNSYVLSCKSLLDGLMSIGGTTRGQNFLLDLSNQILSDPNDVNNGYYYIPFRVGDMLSLKLTYKFGPNISGLPFIDSIGNRSYKIVLKCVT